MRHIVPIISIKFFNVIMGSSLHVRFLIGMVFSGELSLFFKTLGDVSPLDFSDQFYRFLLGSSGAGWSV